MTYLLLTALTAAVLGMRHATDGDHVAAVSAIVAREGSVWRASRVGFLWGAGHTATVALAGAAIVAFSVEVPAGANHVLEGCVALMLMGLGARNLMSAQEHRTQGTLAPFAVGAVHGLAGSAAFALLLIPLVADPMWAAAYVAAFGIGTVAGMTLLTFLIAGSTRAVAARLRDPGRLLRLATGALSLAFGAALLYRAASGGI